MKQFRPTLGEAAKGLSDIKPHTKTFAEVLNECIKSSGQSEAQLTEQSGLGRNAIRLLKAGERPPTRREFKRLKRALPRIKVYDGTFTQEQIIVGGHDDTEIPKPQAREVKVAIEEKQADVIIEPREPDKAPTTAVEVVEERVSPLIIKTKVDTQYTRIETIDPELAEALLQGNVRNRNISMQLVDCMVRDMKAGNWRVSHQGIAVDKDARLLDGQHRLTAIVKSGVTVQMAVTYNVDPEAFGVIDLNNRPRTQADILGLTYDTKYSRALVAALKLIGTLSTGIEALKARPTFAETEALFKLFGEEVQWATIHIHRRSGLHNAGVLAAVGYAYPTNKEFFAEFVEKLVSRVAMTSTMAALWKAVERVKNRGDSRIEIAHLTLRAFMAAEKGQDLTKVYKVKSRQSNDKEVTDHDAAFRHFRARREKMKLPS